MDVSTAFSTHREEAVENFSPFSHPFHRPGPPPEGPADGLVLFLGHGSYLQVSYCPIIASPAPNCKPGRKFSLRLAL